MEERKIYEKKAKDLLSAGFWVAGQGHFTVYEDEIAFILELLDDPNRKKKLKDFYLKLSEKHL